MCKCQGNPLARVTLALRLGLPYLPVNRAEVSTFPLRKFHFEQLRGREIISVSVNSRIEVETSESPRCTEIFSSLNGVNTKEH